MTTAPAIHLRDMTEEDSAFSYQVFASSREDDVRYLPLGNEAKERFLRQQFDMQHRYYHEHFAQAAYQVIERDGFPVGRLYVDRQADQILIIDIALVPEWRGTGIGSILIEEILSEAAATGRPVRLHVEQFNRAFHWYERLGFQPIEDAGIYVFMEWLPR